MDIAQAMGAMQNPQGMLMQYAVQGMIAQNMMIVAENQKTRDMFTQDKFVGTCKYVLFTCTLFNV